MNVTTEEGTHPPITLCMESQTQSQKNYTKLDTHCANKFKTTQGLRVIIPCGSLMKNYHREEINLSHLLSTRSKNSHIPPHPQ